MKIAFTGVTLAEGKAKYLDPIVLALAEKYQPKKVSPYFFEFLPDAYQDADAIVIAKELILDLLILDIEKIENRLSRVDVESERDLLKKCQSQLEGEMPLCDLAVSEDEREVIAGLNFFSAKPVIVTEDKVPDLLTLCPKILEKSGHMFFYTTGKAEVHAWLVRKGSDAVTCAGKIHSDLARGFVKAEICGFDELITVHNLQDARSKGLTRLVDRDFVIEERTVIDIRFNV
jgi:ribosome-binding ATPase YchF (GTP1/OBG family)